MYFIKKKSRTDLYDGYWYKWAIAYGYDKTLMCTNLRLMNKSEVEKIVNAINQAIIARG